MGGKWVSPLFAWKTWRPFFCSCFHSGVISPVQVVTPQPFLAVRPRFFTILCKFAHTNFFPLGVTPLEGVTRGGPPPHLVTPLRLRTISVKVKLHYTCYRVLPWFFSQKHSTVTCQSFSHPVASVIKQCNLNSVAAKLRGKKWRPRSCICSSTAEKPGLLDDEICDAISSAIVMHLTDVINGAEFNCEWRSVKWWNELCRAGCSQLTFTNCDACTDITDTQTSSRCTSCLAGYSLKDDASTCTSKSATLIETVS